MLQSSYTIDFIEAGCDEVGRGCLAGPVVSAAVILPKKYEHPLLTDSKKLTKKQRESLEEEIKECALSWSIAEVSPPDIDKMNILNASFEAMHKAINGLQILPELLLIDGNRFKKHSDIPHVCIVKGDSKFLSIAAASILAKTYRDRLMHSLSIEFPLYGWETNVGYPTPKHREGILNHGITPHHRKSFQLIQLQTNLFHK